jgi:sec-independent protein translocase protein TatA
MRFPQGAEWLIILVLILLLFGAKRLPDMARSLGRSARILKSETKGLRDDESTDAAAAPAPALPATATEPPAVAPAPTQNAAPAPAPAPEVSDSQTKPTAS